MQMPNSLITGEFHYGGYVIQYGAYEREGQSQGWNGFYRIFKGAEKIHDSDEVRETPFVTRANAEICARE